MVWKHPRDRKPATKKIPKLFNHINWQACFVDWVQSLTPRTAELYGGAAGLFFTNPKRTPDTYSQQEARAFINSCCRTGSRKGLPPAVNTRNTRLTALNSFYAFAAGYDVKFRTTMKPLMSRRPPTHNIKILESPESNRAINDDDLARFFGAISHDTIVGKRDHALFLCYFWTGRRLREICFLTWGDIQQEFTFEDGSVGIRYSWIGKRRVNKSYAEMPAAAWESIVEYLKASERWETMTPTSPIFVAHDSAAIYRGERFLEKSSIGKIYRKYCKEAGLTGRVGVHDFRHTCAGIQYIASNYNILEVQAKLDHRNVAATMRYLKHAVSKGDATARKLRSRYGDL